jgi:hypothetical protein
MKRTVFQCAGNVLSFTFMGLAFLFPASEVVKTETGIGASLTFFPFLMIGFPIVYFIIYLILAKKYRWGKGDNSELAYSDEREKIIVAESTKVAYKVLIGGLIFVIPAIGGANFFSIFTGTGINIYMVAITLLTLLLNTAMISYCVKWYLEYKK